MHVISNMRKAVYLISDITCKLRANNAVSFIAAQCVYKRALAKHISACTRVVAVVELTDT